MQQQVSNGVQMMRLSNESTPVCPGVGSVRRKTIDGRVAACLQNNHIAATARLHSGRRSVLPRKLVSAMRKLLAAFVATVAAAGQAQSPLPWTSGPPEARSAATMPASDPMTRQELFACVEHEDNIGTREAALEARVAEHDKEGRALDAEVRAIDEARQRMKTPDRAGADALSRRIGLYNQRYGTLNANAENLGAVAAQLREDVSHYNLSCASRPYNARDKELALTYFEERKMLAGTAAAFQEGLKAFDQGKYQAALTLWLPVAERGRASAQFKIAVMFEQGLGVEKSDVEAARWYLKAARSGDVASQLKIGTLYEAGQGLAVDLGSATYWYGEAAKGSANDASAAQQARERLARLPKAYRAGPEDTVKFDGGRFLLRRSADGECIIALQGTVTRSARFEFENVLTRAKAQHCAQPLILLLESPGGSHDEGMSLARRVRAEGMRTMARYDCASSCATVFLGGTERVLWGARAAIGFHQIARVKDGERLEDGDCVLSRIDPGVVALRRYLRFAIPETADEIFRIAMDTPCKSIAWVSGKRALDLKVAIRIEAEGDDVFGPIQDRLDQTISAPR